MEHFLNGGVLKPLEEVLEQNGFLPTSCGCIQGAREYWEEGGMVVVTPDNLRPVSKGVESVNPVWFAELAQAYGIRFVDTKRA